MTRKLNILSSLAILITVAGALAGCAVLTKSQVKEVERLAQATKTYDQLPGDAIRAYQEAFLTGRELEITSRAIEDKKDADANWQKLVEAVGLDRQLAEQAGRADDALQVIDTYAELLGQLTADTFTRELEKSSEALAESLEKAIAKYNKVYGANLDASFSSAVAAAVRGLGGIYIKWRQAKLLRAYVELFDRAVPTLTEDVVNLAELLSCPCGDSKCACVSHPSTACPSHIRLCAELSAVQVRFWGAAKRSRRADFDTVDATATVLRRLQATCELGTAAASGARRYRAAHAALRANLEKRRRLTALIEEVQVLVNEMKAARKLRDKLSKS